MLSALVSQDLALDLGSSRTRLYVRGAGVAVDVPSVVAVRTRRSGRRELIALGDEAHAMLGRTPDSIQTVRPIRQGAVADEDIARALVEHLVHAVHGRRTWVRPRVLIAVSRTLSLAAQRGLRTCCESAGARDVALLPRSVAAARGAGLPTDAASGHMLVDVGGATTQISVVCRGEVVTSTVLDVAGDVFDGAILRLLKRDHALLVGAPSAERLKREVGAAADPPEASRTIAGRCLRTGVPRAVTLDASTLCATLADPVAAIGAAIRRVLEQTPPEIASDVVDHGVILCGGGSQLRNLDLALRASTGLAVLPVDGASHAVIRGAGLALEHDAPFSARGAARFASVQGRALLTESG